MPTNTDTDALTDRPLSTLDTADRATATPGESGHRIDRLTGTTAEDRTALFNDAKERISEAVASAVTAVKDNPKTAAAIAAGATAAVAGAAYGATKLAKGSATKRANASKSSTRGTAKGSTAKK